MQVGISITVTKRDEAYGEQVLLVDSRVCAPIRGHTAKTIGRSLQIGVFMVAAIMCGIGAQGLCGGSSAWRGGDCVAHTRLTTGLKGDSCGRLFCGAIH